MSNPNITDYPLDPKTQAMIEAGNAARAEGGMGFAEDDREGDLTGVVPNNVQPLLINADNEELNASRSRHPAHVRKPVANRGRQVGDSELDTGRPDYHKLAEVVDRTEDEKALAIDSLAILRRQTKRRRP